MLLGADVPYDFSLGVGVRTLPGTASGSAVDGSGADGGGRADGRRTLSRRDSKARSEHATARAAAGPGLGRAAHPRPHPRPRPRAARGVSMHDARDTLCSASWAIVQARAERVLRQQLRANGQASASEAAGLRVRRVVEIRRRALSPSKAAAKQSRGARASEAEPVIGPLCSTFSGIVELLGSVLDVGSGKARSGACGTAPAQRTLPNFSERLPLLPAPTPVSLRSLQWFFASRDIAHPPPFVVAGADSDHDSTGDSQWGTDVVAYYCVEERAAALAEAETDPSAGVAAGGGSTAPGRAEADGRRWARDAETRSAQSRFGDGGAQARRRWAWHRPPLDGRQAVTCRVLERARRALHLDGVRL